MVAPDGAQRVVEQRGAPLVTKVQVCDDDEEQWRRPVVPARTRDMPSCFAVRAAALCENKVVVHGGWVRIFCAPSSRKLTRRSAP